jgi:hypothetical protein
VTYCKIHAAGESEIGLCLARGSWNAANDIEDRESDVHGDRVSDSYSYFGSDYFSFSPTWKLRDEKLKSSSQRE